MMTYDNGSWWGLMMLMPVVWIALLAVIVWAIVRLAQSRDHPRDSVDREPRPDTPEEILARRFAAGEIDSDAYTAARELLGR